MVTTYCIEFNPPFEIPATDEELDENGRNRVANEHVYLFDPKTDRNLVKQIALAGITTEKMGEVSPGIYTLAESIGEQFKVSLEVTDEGPHLLLSKPGETHRKPLTDLSPIGVGTRRRDLTKVGEKHVFVSTFHLTKVYLRRTGGYRVEPLTPTTPPEPALAR